MKVLVTGAAGYIGSHVALALERDGHEVVRLDDFTTGHEKNLLGRPCVRASVHDAQRVRAALTGCDAVAHLAGSCLVPESVRSPEKYWWNNLAGGASLVRSMLDAGVGSLVFSSTCAVYGVPARVPIQEDEPHAPITPYGSSKSAFERLLREVSAAHGLRSVVLRYFNAAGADGSGELAERHEPETHLIPLVLGSIAGSRGTLVVHGTDHATPDGTCVRDYVDVRDIADAHGLALRRLLERRLDGTFNLGHGKGHSVREVIRTCEQVTGRRAPVVDGPRRDGDPPVLVADATRAREVLGWTPRHGLDDMIGAAWAASQ